MFIYIYICIFCIFQVNKYIYIYYIIFLIFYIFFIIYMFWDITQVLLYIIYAIFLIYFCFVVLYLFDFLLHFFGYIYYIYVYSHIWRALYSTSGLQDDYMFHCILQCHALCRIVRKWNCNKKRVNFSGNKTTLLKTTCNLAKIWTGNKKQRKKQT